MGLDVSALDAWGKNGYATVGHLSMTGVAHSVLSGAVSKRLGRQEACEHFKPVCARGSSAVVFMAGSRQLHGQQHAAAVKAILPNARAFLLAAAPIREHRLVRLHLPHAECQIKNGKEGEVEINKHPNKGKIRIKFCGLGALRLPSDTCFGLVSEISRNKLWPKFDRPSFDAASNPAAVRG